VCVRERERYGIGIVVGVKTRTLIIAVVVVFAISINIGRSPIENGRFALLGLLLGISASDNVEKRLLLLLSTRGHGSCFVVADEQFGGNADWLSSKNEAQLWVIELGAIRTVCRTALRSAPDPVVLSVTRRGQKMLGKLLQPSMSHDDYYEEQVWPLTSYTNCYTAYTRDGRWATQRHVCWHDVKQDTAESTTNDDSRATTTTVRWSELPPGRLCVGYSSSSSCAAPYGGWEAYGLLPDHHWQQQQPEEQPPPSSLPVQVVSTATSAIDGTSTISNDNNIITAAAVAGVHSRSPSLVGLPMNLPSSTSELDSIYNNMSVPELSSSVDNNNDNPLLTEPLPETATTLRGRADHNNNNNVAELIVRNYVSTTGDGAVTTSQNGENIIQHYSLWLSYRPTAIHFTMTTTMMLRINDRATTTMTTPLVWMGSADHAQLHSYEIAAINNNNNEPDDDSGDDDDDNDGRDDDIGPVLQLRHNHEFPASVLAIASNSDGRKLVVASQDGSIVILQLLCNGDGDDETGRTPCRLVTEATVIIDGPILALSYRQDGTITIGSLCGYVARMKDDGTKLEMIVEGLTGHNSQEDAVLAVAATSSDNNGDGHRIWVGTRSGRCLLYRLRCNSDDVPSNSCCPVAPSSSSSCWKLEWQVRLPYAVNGIRWDNDVVVDDTRQKRVIVTTARGIHIFRTVHSAVQQARNRLNDLRLNK
jgi:hypothetical protein